VASSWPSSRRECKTGEVFCVYDSGKVVPQGKDTEAMGKILDLADRLTPEEFAALRLRLSPMSPTALLDAYLAAWTRCNIERDGKPPQARFIQELVKARKALRKAR
jgi:hypothetical protein